MIFLLHTALIELLAVVARCSNKVDWSGDEGDVTNPLGVATLVRGLTNASTEWCSPQPHNISNVATAASTVMMEPTSFETTAGVVPFLIIMDGHAVGRLLICKATIGASISDVSVAIYGISNLHIHARRCEREKRRSQASYVGISRDLTTSFAWGLVKPLSLPVSCLLVLRWSAVRSISWKWLTRWHLGWNDLTSCNWRLLIHEMLSKLEECSQLWCSFVVDTWYLFLFSNLLCIQSFILINISAFEFLQLSP